MLGKSRIFCSSTKQDHEEKDEFFFRFRREEETSAIKRGFLCFRKRALLGMSAQYSSMSLARYLRRYGSYQGIRFGAGAGAGVDPAART
jgi:hypothetical protein